MKKLSERVIYLFSALVGIAQTSITYAQTILPEHECIQQGTCRISDLPVFIYLFGTYVVRGVGTISVILIIIGGYQWMLGGVSEELKGKAKKTILYAIVGLCVTGCSWIIVNVVQINVATT